MLFCALVRSADAERNHLLQGVFLAACREDRERIVRDAAIRPCALERRFDRLVPLHKGDRAFEVAILDVAFGNRAIPELALFLGATA